MTPQQESALDRWLTTEPRWRIACIECDDEDCDSGSDCPGPREEPDPEPEEAWEE